ncbi:hypothetical protein H9P43_001619 [Blastocladiella emersonii ATCC 22665]|nr:hypothetical protein H9P43_001606 [Blastocladiella emersonii ATCC 22665]KAI9190186.1 hypothetical protein H9P43_001619 [Blastocladiella emersonii ATCC 22665]
MSEFTRSDSTFTLDAGGAGGGGGGGFTVDTSAAPVPAVPQQPVSTETYAAYAAAAMYQQSSAAPPALSTGSSPQSYHPSPTNNNSPDVPYPAPSAASLHRRGPHRADSSAEDIYGTVRAQRRTHEEDDDEGREFNWEIDNGFDVHSLSDDSSKNNGSRRCGFVSAWLNKLPYWLRCLLSALFGDTLIFGLLGVPDLLFGIEYYEPDGKYRPFNEWTSPLNIGGMPLLHWSIYLCISWTLHYLTLFVLSIVPALLTRMLGIALGSYYEERLSEYLNYFRVMHRRITVSVWIILSNVIFTAFVIIPGWRWKRIFKSTGDADWFWFDYVSKILLTLFVFHTLWTVEKLLLEIISTRFHRRAYKDRIKVSRAANGFLENLLVSLRSPRPRVSESSSGGGAAHGHAHRGSVSAQGTPVPSRPTSLRRGSHAVPPPPTTPGTATPATTAVNDAEDDEMAKIKNRSKAGLSRAGQFIAKQAGKTLNDLAAVAVLDPYALTSASSIPETPNKANLMARDLFTALAKPGCSDLDVHDFRPYFGSEPEARRAFRFFDRNNSGDVSKEEMKAVLTELCQEKRDIEKSIADVTSAVASLDWFLGAIVIFLSFIITCNIFVLPVASYMSAIAAVLLPSSFIFGTSAREIFESALFLFVQHYFDVGDTILLDNTYYTVKSVSILTTTLQRGDGKLVYAPNSILNKKMIDNVRRSGHMSEDVVIKLHISTRADQLDALRHRMLAFLDANARDYKPAFTLTIKEVLLAESALRCKVTIEHNGNWQEMGKRAARRNAYMFALRHALLETGIMAPTTAAPETGEH